MRCCESLFFIITRNAQKLCSSTSFHRKSFFFLQKPAVFVSTSNSLCIAMNLVIVNMLSLLDKAAYNCFSHTNYIGISWSIADILNNLTSHFYLVITTETQFLKKS